MDGNSLDVIHYELVLIVVLGLGISRYKGIHLVFEPRHTVTRYGHQALGLRIEAVHYGEAVISALSHEGIAIASPIIINT